MNKKNIFVTVWCFTQISSAFELQKIFDSIIRPTMTKQNMDIGLILDKSNIELSLPNGFSFCVKFNYRVLGWDSKLVSIGCSNEFNVDCIWIPVGYYLTFVGVGNFNWILKQSDSIGVENDNFLVWTTNQWHQVCLAFDASTSMLSFIKVRQVLKCKSQVYVLYL